MSDHIIIISCSNGKARGGNAAYNPDDSITAFLPPEIQQTVWERRRTIADWIIAGQVEDRLRGDGNRRDSRYNIDLKMGPDLGAGLSEICPPDAHSDMRQESQSKATIKYLPAYERYDGRFFVNAGLETFEKAIVDECHVLIVSGLYGLLLPEELIQAYNCHLDDEVLDSGMSADYTDDGTVENADARISGIWRRHNLPNRILQAFIEDHNKQNDHTIKHVIDLLSETSYQRLFNWDELYGWFKRNGISWFHRMVQGVREPAFLPDLARYFRYDLVEQGFSVPPPGKVVREYLHTINENGGHLEFTKRIRPEPFTANLLQSELGDFTWRNLETLTQEDLIHGELFFQLYNALSTKQPDEIAPRIVNFFSALENELHSICRPKVGKGSLGEFIHRLCQGELKDCWPDKQTCAAMCSELARLLTIRNCMSHRGVVRREGLLAARNTILKKDGLLAALVTLKMARPEFSKRSKR